METMTPAMSLHVNCRMLSEKYQLGDRSDMGMLHSPLSSPEADPQDVNGFRLSRGEDYLKMPRLEWKSEK